MIRTLTDKECLERVVFNFRYLPQEVRVRAVEALRLAIPEREQLQFAEMIRANPATWWAKDRFHFDGGMAIRNFLRTGVGILDKDLPGGPDRGWDDYYVGLIEVAVREGAYHRLKPEEQI
jgi:hypothetical protein